MRRSVCPLALALITTLITAVAAPPTLRAEPMTDADRQRWSDLVTLYFPGRTPEPAEGRLKLVAPERAADAALVPITIEMAPAAEDPVTTLHFLVDDNPVPKAFSLTFGPGAVAHSVQTRVRINEYTFVHAVAETQSGRLLETAAFIKASGGCSAPALKDPEQAMARLGRMKLNLPATVVPGEPVEAQLLISHPNASGLQFDQISRTYIPPHYVEKVTVRYNGTVILTAAMDISLSEDPSLHFQFMPTAAGTLDVEAVDSKGQTFTASWPVGTTPM